MIQHTPIQLIYLHGFNSGFNSDSQKILDLKILSNKVVGSTVNYLNPDELKALEIKIEKDISCFVGETIIVGTSLGGYFARYFSNKFNLRAILINPAVKPYESIKKAIGIQKNFFTGESYTVTREAVEYFINYETIKVGKALMILATDDDVIPYQKSIEFYGKDSEIVLTVGGHRLESLANVIPQIRNFINT